MLPIFSITNALVKGWKDVLNVCFVTTSESQSIEVTIFKKMKNRSKEKNWSMLPDEYTFTFPLTLNTHKRKDNITWCSTFYFFFPRQPLTKSTFKVFSSKVRWANTATSFFRGRQCQSKLQRGHLAISLDDCCCLFYHIFTWHTMQRSERTLENKKIIQQ